MAEIKSTLELAMEKSKKMGISEEERKEMKRKEVSQKVKGFFHRYMDGHTPLNEILKEIEKMGAGTEALAKEILLSQWIEALSLKDDAERLVHGIESVKGQDLKDMKEKVQRLLSQYREEEEKLRHDVTAQSIEVLKREGIWGSAVEPNPGGSEAWEKELEKLQLSYSKKLEEIKGQLRSL